VNENVDNNEFTDMVSLSERVFISDIDLVRILLCLDEHGSDWLSDNRHSYYSGMRNKIAVFKYKEKLYTGKINLVGVKGEGLFCVEAEGETIPVPSLPWIRIFSIEKTNIRGLFISEEYRASLEQERVDGQDIFERFFNGHAADSSRLKRLSIHEIENEIALSIQKLINSKIEKDETSWKCNIESILYEPDLTEKATMKITLTRSLFKEQQ
jgi:hypothetical protein